MRQESREANGPETARQAHGERVVLERMRDSQDDPAAIPSHTLDLPSGSSLWPTRNGDATAPTANSETARTTARKGRRRARTAWELRELIHPEPPPRRRTAKRPALQPFYPVVVEGAYRLRYSTAGMLQRLYPAWLPSERTAQRHLAGLVDGGFLATTTIRNTARNFPLVYFSTARGLRMIRDAYAAHDVDWQGTVTEQRRARGQALETVVHELLVSELMVGLRQSIEGRDDLRLLYEERRFFRPDRKLTVENAARHIIPDAGFLAARIDRDGQWLLPLSLIEMDNGTEPVAKIRRKYAAYTRWADEGREYRQELYRRFGVRRTRPPFRLLVVAHNKYDPAGDERRLLDLFGQALDLPDGMRRRMWFATASDLEAHQFDESPLGAALWYRVGDVEESLPKYRLSLSRIPHTKTMQRSACQRAFVAEQLPTLPQHSLFPLPRSS